MMKVPKTNYLWASDVSVSHRSFRAISADGNNRGLSGRCLITTLMSGVNGKLSKRTVSISLSLPLTVDVD